MRSDLPSYPQIHIPQPGERDSALRVARSLTGSRSEVVELVGNSAMVAQSKARMAQGDKE